MLLKKTVDGLCPRPFFCVCGVYRFSQLVFSERLNGTQLRSGHSHPIRYWHRISTHCRTIFWKCDRWRCTRRYMYRPSTHPQHRAPANHICFHTHATFHKFCMCKRLLKLIRTHTADTLGACTTPRTRDPSSFVLYAFVSRSEKLLYFI